MAARGECPWCGIVDKSLIELATEWALRHVTVTTANGKGQLVKLVYDPRVIAPMTKADRRSRSRGRWLPFQVGCGVFVLALVTGSSVWLLIATLAFVVGVICLAVVKHGPTEWSRRQAEDVALARFLADRRFRKGTVTVQVVDGMFQIVPKPMTKREFAEFARLAREL
ncbi:hypothetical protein [Actinopolymorpha sp. B9G3]|uniref:hypothetical protein n=1 Tax=Actinopolymorpha sp. B9G3 TaxID=3158970 RepID=UPI0032D8FAC6